jgi:hypothetical protein
VRADLVRRAEAGVGGDLRAHPGPDVLSGVEIGAVGLQADQAQVQVGRGEIVPQGAPPWAGALSQNTTSGVG